MAERLSNREHGDQSDECYVGCNVLNPPYVRDEAGSEFSVTGRGGSD